jgi:hypothetical protein
MSRKGQISIDLLLAVILFAIIFSVFFAFGDVSLKNLDTLRNDSDLISQASKLKPQFASLGLPNGYSLTYTLECQDYFFNSDQNGYYVSSTKSVDKKLVAKEKIADYFCNTEMYFLE